MSPPPTSPLHTTELLELILSHLPPRDLLLAQRICSQWHTLISTSPTLQSLLYFQVPSTPTPPPPSYTLNPLLLSAFPVLFSQKHTHLDPDEQPTWAAWAASLRADHDDARDLPTLFTESANKFLYSRFNAHPEAFRRREASWRRMHICSPPVRTFVFRSSVSSWGQIYQRECAVRIGGGRQAGNGGEAEVLGIPHISEDEEPLDLEREGGVKMDVLYDCLFDLVCRGDPHACRISFARGVYPSTEEVAPYAAENDDISLKVMMGLGAGAETGVDDGGGVTLMLEEHSAIGCVESEAEDDLPQFKSEGYRNLAFEPLTSLPRPWVFD